MEARCVAVAYSGGRDSTALLHATLAEASDHGVRVLALHVHHGLSAHADAWLAHCEAQCRRWARAGKPLDFVSQRLAGSSPPGASIEAWARQGRYAALREMALAHGATIVLLAHHRRDQAETLLLQALRGAGTAGLAGMPRHARRDGVDWLRPWLDRPREAIDAYIRRHRLSHIDDDSNIDQRFARNRLREQVWPALTAAFPQAEASLATAAQWAQQAQQALDELAALDLGSVADDDGLNVARWQRLSPARQSNALRAWLKARLGGAAPASLVARLLVELPQRRSGARWPLASAGLRVYRGVLRCGSDLAAPAAASPKETGLCIEQVGDYALPGWSGILHVEAAAERGVPLAWLARATLRERVGGEQYQAGIGRPPRSLKKQFQEAALPAWEREGPLVYSGGQLVFVPGLGLDARVLGLPGQALVDLRWAPAAPR